MRKPIEKITMQDALKLFNEFKADARRNKGDYESLRDELKYIFWQNHDAVYDLVFSGLITDEKDLETLILFGGEVVSHKRSDWSRWAPLLRRVAARMRELPENIQHDLEWRSKVYILETPQQECLRILNGLINHREFNLESSMERIIELKDDEKITFTTFIMYVNALHSYQRDGHFENSLMYKLASGEIV